MQKMEELKDMLCEELDKITKKGELSAGSLDVIDKLTHSIKSIDTIMAMEKSGYSNESGYSRRMYGRHSYGNSYDDGRSYDGGSYARGGRTGANQYGSYDDGSEMIVRELKGLMNDAPNEQIKMEFRKLIQKMEQM